MFFLKKKMKKKEKTFNAKRTCKKISFLDQVKIFKNIIYTNYYKIL